MIQGKTRRWEVPTRETRPLAPVYAVKWTTTVCRECRNEYLRYWEGSGVPERLVTGVECFHLTEDVWPPEFRQGAAPPVEP